MGRKPGVWMMGLLEQRARAVSGEFKPQDVANKMWACGKGRKSGERWIQLLDGRAKATSVSSIDRAAPEASETIPRQFNSQETLKSNEGV
jgi:hypothetical protein